MTDFNELIPELSLWNDGKGIDVDLWINGIGSFEHAIAYGNLFWPKFVEHDGCIFVGGVDSKNYKIWLKKLRGDKAAIERLLNHLHLDDLFPNASARTMKQKIYLAKLIKEMWESKLKRDFPELEFEVILIDCEASGDDWKDCQITVVQKRNAT
jgi:hypothetical protein